MSNTTNHSGSKAKPVAKPKAGLVLFESDTFDGFTTQDVLTGLHGVCVALTAVDTDHYDQVAELAMAARVLSSIMRRRVASSKEVRA